RAWQPIRPSTNQSPSTNSLDWYDRGALAAPNAQFPVWSAATAYVPLGPVCATGPVSFVGTYIEGGAVYGYAHAPNGTVVGNDMGWTHKTATLQAHPGNTLGLVSKRGIGHYRSTAGNPDNPAYAAIGDEEWTAIGAADLDFQSDLTKRAMILSHRVNGNDWLWRYVNADMVASYYNGQTAFSISGKGTARTYGRSAIQEGYFTLHDHALMDSTNSNNARVHGMRDAAPTSGSHAQGEFYFNANPTAAGTFGWVCTASGTPGTWTAVPVGGFGGNYSGDSSFGNVTIGTGVDNKALLVTNTSGTSIRAAMNANTSSAYLDCRNQSTLAYGQLNLRGTNVVLYESGNEVLRSVAGGVQVTGVIQVGANQVVGARGAAVADATDAASAITQLNALLARCRAHGLIA
ncbi:MAG: hypothetical protein ABR588_02575, partial [Sphingomicrobium sp.]